MTRLLKENKKSLFILGGVFLICAILLCIFLLLNGGGNTNNGEHILRIETPQKLSASQTDVFCVDVTISSFGDTIYPAASMSIAFDSSRLEFLGIEEGNVFVRNDENTSGQSLPTWSCNAEASNKSGLINVMYLDVTSGKFAFSKDLLSDENNVVLRLAFRLRKSAREGDVCDLIVEDAVFAASNQSQSLAMNRNTLTVKNGKIVIGE